MCFAVPFLLALRALQAPSNRSMFTFAIRLTQGACGSLECHALPPPIKPTWYVQKEPELVI
jgi:hypothetical protein